MAVIKIYGVRSAYDAACYHYYRLRPDAEAELAKLQVKYPDLGYTIHPALYDDGLSPSEATEG